MTYAKPSINPYMLGKITTNVGESSAVLGSQCGLGVSPSRAPGESSAVLGSPQVEQLANPEGVSPQVEHLANPKGSNFPFHPDGD